MPAPPNPDEPVDLPIPDGSTWMDETGRTWTSHGSLVMSDDSIQSVRQNLIAFLKQQHGKWQWSDYPTENTQTPFVTLVPSDPYIVPWTQGPGSMMWNFELVIGLNRAKPEQALRRLEFMFEEI